MKALDPQHARAVAIQSWVSLGREGAVISSHGPVESVMGHLEELWGQLDVVGSWLQCGTV